MEEVDDIEELINNFEYIICSTNEKILKVDFIEINLVNEVIKHCFTNIIQYEKARSRIIEICNSININGQMIYINNNNKKIIFLTILYMMENSNMNDQQKVNLISNSKNFSIEIKVKISKIKIKTGITKRDIKKIKKELAIIEIDTEKLEKFIKNNK